MCFPAASKTISFKREAGQRRPLRRTGTYCPTVINSSERSPGLPLLNVCLRLYSRLYSEWLSTGGE